MRRTWLPQVLPYVLIIVIALAVLHVTIYCHPKTKLVVVGDFQSRDRNQPQSASLDLGVRMIRPVYAILPETQDGRKNVTVLLTVWLKRVGASSRPFDLPHQAQDSIRLMVWVDNPLDIHNRQWGHLKMPVDHNIWKPKILLETPEPGPILRAEYEPQREHQGMVGDHIIRPYSFRVDLPEGVGNCFKVIEASYLKHKAPICLPPGKEDPTCDFLASADKYNTSSPALYTTIGAIRTTASGRNWNEYQSQVAGRLWNYVTYQVAMGAAGLLLYADELQRQYLTRDPRTAELIQRGHLRLVEWDMPERGHSDDGRGRPLGYNYDQALFASHVNLGLSACGSNLWVIVTDIDEFIYIPKPGHRWPEALHKCMMDTAAPNVTVYSLQRFEVLPSTIPVDQERFYWITPGKLGGQLPAGCENYSDLGSKRLNFSFVHPLEFYDRVYSQPLSELHGKAIIQPAARTVLFFVHDAVPLYGRTHLVDYKCMVLLHVPNFHGPRKNLNETQLRHFRHWALTELKTSESEAAVE